MTFSWEKFDLAFLKEIIKATDDVEDTDLYLRSNDKDIVVSCVNMICDHPDKKFVMKYRQIIEQYVLVNYPEEVKNICKSLNISSRSFNEKQSMMTKKAMSASLINAYVAALLNISGMTIYPSEYSSFRYTRSLNMAETKIEEIPLYDFQRTAVNSLKEHFITNDEKSGLLVMPTGSGKSRTATYFLISEMVSRGYQVIWLAHRYMLLDQAADCFYRFAGLSKVVNPGIRNYRISCISGEHLRISQVDKHEIIVASINSVCRNKDHLKRILGKKVVVVVDEAHHTFAPTYQETIRFIQKCRKDTKLLGLTATPVRANDEDSKSLLKLYDNKIVYSVSMSDLIAKGILATPKFVRKETNEDFESVISVDEEKLIQRFGELPESLISKIVASKSRNNMIVDEYIKNQEKYGKTIIFAMNVVHCRFLQEELSKRKIRCGCIYSGKDDNTAVINDFKENRIDVLVNINIMTEGTDVPDIQTVFLTRPTQSEGFLMQMIGRGMRGISAHGTESVYIVDFHDKWTVFNRWLNPEWVLSDEDSAVDPKRTGERKKQIYREYEWEMCRELYRGLSFQYESIGREVMLPVGWYTLIDEEGELVRMLIFENQINGITKMTKDKAIWKDNPDFTAKDALDHYFNDFAEKPSLYELQLLMDNMRNNEVMPTRYLLEHRKTIDPVYVAGKAGTEGKDVFQLASEVYDEYEIVGDLYPSKEEYLRKVCEAKIYAGKKIVLGQKVEELPEEWIPFDRTPFYNLPELLQEVKDEMFQGEFDGLGTISWTALPYKMFYGRHWFETHDIEINSVLNSRDVPREVVKYVLYHEMLHRDYPYHDKEFKEMEHRYPQYEEWDHFLDDNMEKFEIREW